MPVWFNEAISDLVCQSSDAEKATEHEVRPMAVWDRKSRTHKRQETNRALRSAGPTVMPHTNTHPIDHLAAVSGEYGDLGGPEMVSLSCVTQMPRNNLSGSKTAAGRVCERGYRDRNTWIWFMTTHTILLSGHQNMLFWMLMSPPDFLTPTYQYQKPTLNNINCQLNQHQANIYQPGPALTNVIQPGPTWIPSYASNKQHKPIRNYMDSLLQTCTKLN